MFLRPFYTIVEARELQDIQKVQMRTRRGKTQSALIGIVVVVMAAAAGLAAFLFLDGGGPLTALGPEYRYDLSEYAAIDPALILYEQRGAEIATGLTQSRAIIVSPNGTLLIAGDRKIVELEPDGGLVRTIECAGEPTCLALDADGTLFVGLIDHIIVFDGEGKQVAEWEKPGADALLTSLAVTGDSVFTADAGHKIVRRYRKDGTPVSDFGQRDPDHNIPGFIIPSPYGFNLAVAPDGLLRVVNPGRHWIEAWTPDGHREWWWGKTSIRVEGFSGCCNPAGLAMLPNGHTITSEKGLVRVKEYDAEGHFVGVVAGPDQLGWVEPLRVYDNPQLSQVRGFGVATDAAGRVYVLDTVRNVVRVFEKKAL